MSDGLARRFYATASWAPAEQGFVVKLDERNLRTPAGKLFCVAAPGLAYACAQEWLAQGETIRPHTMPLTRLANVALDRTPLARDEIAANIASYVETDLVAHRAQKPAALVARQAAAWDPLVEWGEARLRARIAVVTGVIAAEADPIARARLEDIARDLDDFRLTALAHAVGLSGSAVTGLALVEGRLDARGAFDAAALDDLYSLETWGEDDEARARLARLEEDLRVVERFIAAL